MRWEHRRLGCLRRERQRLGRKAGALDGRWRSRWLEMGASGTVWGIGDKSRCVRDGSVGGESDGDAERWIGLVEQWSAVIDDDVVCVF